MNTLCYQQPTLWSYIQLLKMYFAGLVIGTRVCVSSSKILFTVLTILCSSNKKTSVGYEWDIQRTVGEVFVEVSITA
jgi:hypothetical protein